MHHILNRRYVSTSPVRKYVQYLGAYVSTNHVCKEQGTIYESVGVLTSMSLFFDGGMADVCTSISG